MGILAKITAGLFLANADPSRGAVEVLRSLQLFEDLIRDLKRDTDPSEGKVWPPLFDKYNRLYVLAVRTKCLSMVGDKNNAHALASTFVRVMEKPKFHLLIAGVNFLFGLVLSVIDDLGDSTLLVRALNALEPWAKKMPICQSLVEQYTDLLKDKYMLPQATTTPSATASIIEEMT